MQTDGIYTKLFLAGATVVCFSVRITAQAKLEAPPRSIELTVDAGVPLRLILAKKLPLNHESTLVTAKLVEPLYAFDREVAPPGSEVLGRIAKLQGVARRERFLAILRGDFTPLRDPEIQFDTLVLKDGTRMPLSTLVFPGASLTVRLGQNGKNKGLKDKALDTARAQIETRKRAVIDAIRTPGKLDRLETAALDRLPYHPLALTAGSRFNAELLKPLDFGPATISGAELEQLGSQPASDSVIEARLTSPLNSAAVEKGAVVEAVLSQPLFAADKHLIYPVGSLLHGKVLQARGARHWHRSGQLRFMFQEIELPLGVEPPVAEAAAPRVEQQHLHTRQVEARLETVDVISKDKVNIDEEGGTKAADSKKRFIAPAVNTLLAGLGGDHDHIKVNGVRTGAYSSNVGGRAISGGVGFGLIGAGIGQLSRPFALSLGYYGAAFSIYTNVIARGQEVVFPKDTRIEIRFGTRAGKPASATPPD
jgi:hypothetical protein